MITITIATDNEAFTEGGGGLEVKRILDEAARRLINSGGIHGVAAIGPFMLRDINGNIVGTLEAQE